LGFGRLLIEEFEPLLLNDSSSVPVEKAVAFALLSEDEEDEADVANGLVCGAGDTEKAEVAALPNAEAVEVKGDAATRSVLPKGDAPTEELNGVAVLADG
jgi:hypothetical protein